ncbi:hypothetical protein [uncultured Nostoc sp.]|uniref:hypothetical protein n=1 Tax=uncultured Nostoc sp. TaxID=340711 RepID=UPI0035CA8C18
MSLEQLKRDLEAAATEEGCTVDNLPQALVNYVCSSYRRYYVDRLYHQTNSEALADKLGLILYFSERTPSNEDIPF